MLSTMTSPVLLVGTEWTACRLNVNVGSNFGTVTPQDFTAVDGAEDLDECASFHGLVWLEIPDEPDPALIFSQTNTENGYEFDEIEVGVWWEPYPVTMYPVEEEGENGEEPVEPEPEDIYVPVPLDANGEPVEILRSRPQEEGCQDLVAEDHGPHSQGQPGEDDIRASGTKGHGPANPVEPSLQAPREYVGL